MRAVAALAAIVLSFGAGVASAAPAQEDQRRAAVTNCSNSRLIPPYPGPDHDDMPDTTIMVSGFVAVCTLQDPRVQVEIWVRELVLQRRLNVDGSIWVTKGAPIRRPGFERLNTRTTPFVARTVGRNFFLNRPVLEASRTWRWRAKIDYTLRIRGPYDPPQTRFYDDVPGPETVWEFR